MFYQSLENLTNRAQRSLEAKQISPIQDHYFTLNNILKYCKEHNLIVYGGYALHEILASRGYEGVYDTEEERPDAEFFASDPIKEAISLCNYIQDANAKKKHYYQIDAKEALHDNTFKIFQNYSDVCDISYIDPQVQEFFMRNYVETHKDINYICLEMMLIDKFRVFANPSAYNRLTKEFKRLTLFMDHIRIKKFFGGVRHKQIDNKHYSGRDLKSFFLQHILDAHEGMGLSYAIITYKDNLLSILTSNYEQIKTLLVGAVTQKYSRVKPHSQQHYTSSLVTEEYAPLFFISDGKLTIKTPENLIIEVHSVEENVYNYYKGDIEVDENRTQRFINHASVFSRMVCNICNLLYVQINDDGVSGAVVNIYKDQLQADYNAFVEDFKSSLRGCDTEDDTSDEDKGYIKSDTCFLNDPKYFSLDYVGKPLSRNKKRIIKRQMQQITGRADFVYNPKRINQRQKDNALKITFKNLSGMRLV